VPVAAKRESMKAGGNTIERRPPHDHRRASRQAITPSTTLKADTRTAQPITFGTRLRQLALMIRSSCCTAFDGT